MTVPGSLLAHHSAHVGDRLRVSGTLCLANFPAVFSNLEALGNSDKACGGA